MKKMNFLKALAAAAALCAAVGCSNTSETPVVPAPSSSAPSAAIYGQTKIAGGDVGTANAQKAATLMACPAGFGDDKITFNWSFVDPSKDGAHAEFTGSTTGYEVVVTAKSGDTSVKPDAPQKVNVKVEVAKNGDATKKAEATFTVTVFATAPALEFIRWKPDPEYTVDEGAVYKKIEAAAKKPGEEMDFSAAIPTPIYNGYSANLASNEINAYGQNEFEFTISDGSVANFTAAGKTDATHAKGISNIAAKCVNTTEKTAVIIRASGTMKLSDKVTPQFNKSTSCKVEKGKKTSFKIFYKNAESDATTDWEYDAKAYGAQGCLIKDGGASVGKYLLMENVYAGVAYTTKAIKCKVSGAANLAQGLGSAVGGTGAIANTTVTAPGAPDGTLTITVDYDNAVSGETKECFVKWQ